MISAAGEGATKEGQGDEGVGLEPRLQYFMVNSMGGVGGAESLFIHGILAIRGVRGVRGVLRGVLCYWLRLS